MSIAPHSQGPHAAFETRMTISIYDVCVKYGIVVLFGINHICWQYGRQKMFQDLRNADKCQKIVILFNGLKCEDIFDLCYGFIKLDICPQSFMCKGRILDTTKSSIPPCLV